MDSSTFKKLLPIAIAVAIWGEAWRSGNIVYYCDNTVTGAVAAANSGDSRVPRIMHLLWCLFFISARFNLSVEAVHIPGAVNTIADAISRNNLPLLFTQIPAAVSARRAIPRPLLKLFLDDYLDWISESWRSRFASCFRPA